METRTKDVKTKGKVIGTAVVEIPETMSELQENHLDSEILSIFGTQLMTNECNRIRAEAQPKATKKAIDAKVAALITEGGELHERFVEAASNPALFLELMEDARVISKKLIEEAADLNGDEG